jgi:transposase
VRAALASDAPPKYVRLPQRSIVDEVKPRIRELLQAFPTMPATVIAERIGWTRSIRVLSGRVSGLRPVHLPPDPASRTSYRAIELKIELIAADRQTRVVFVDHLGAAAVVAACGGLLAFSPPTQR